MERYIGGEDAAFDELYESVAPRLYAFLLRRLKEPAPVEDVMQQTFLRIHRSRASFLPGAPTLPWAFAIARRLVIDGARRRHCEHI